VSEASVPPPHPKRAQTLPSSPPTSCPPMPHSSELLPRFSLECASEKSLASKASWDSSSPLLRPTTLDLEWQQELVLHGRKSKWGKNLAKFLRRAQDGCWVSVLWTTPFHPDLGTLSKVGVPQAYCSDPKASMYLYLEMEASEEVRLIEGVRVGPWSFMIMCPYPKRCQTAHVLSSFTLAEGAMGGNSEEHSPY
jgi:hypothetical protein